MAKKKSRRRLEAHKLEAWGIAQTIHIGDAIPTRCEKDLRSDLYLRYAKKCRDFEDKENFGGSVYEAMRHDIMDEIRRRNGPKAQFEENMESLERKDSETGEAYTNDIMDETATLEKFLGELDRQARRQRLRQWKKDFRKAVRKLPRYLRDFLYALRDATSQNEIATAKRISRKTCFLRRKKLQEIFYGLLRQHRNITALEIR